MANKNINSDSNSKNNPFASTHKSNFPIPSKYKNVEPLPESSRPRRDGPGGEDGQ
jgi:hypothetical protein